MKTRIFVVLLMSCVLPLSAQELLINEIVSSNETYFSTVGDTPDWIELYNSSGAAIDLTGYCLSDDSTDLQKWSFKNGQLEADSFNVVFASGINQDSLSNDKFSTIDDIRAIGWDFADIDNIDNPGTSEIRYTLFANSAFGTIDGKPVVAAEIYLGNYPLGLSYSYAGVHVKFDTWDVSVDRSGYDHLRVLLNLEKDKRAKIQFSQSGLEDWANFSYEVVGTGDSIWYDIPIVGDVGALDLSVLTGLTITSPDDQLDESFTFSLHSIEFSSSLVERYHTNFKISSKGETIYLSNPEGELIDEVPVPVLIEDISYGRETDGATNFVRFVNPTPAASNGGEIINGICDAELLFSHTSGFYPVSQEIILSGSDEIRYTTDGSDPVNSSTLYVDGITLDTNTVLKIACFTGGALPKNILTNTYFIGYETSLPVWSISTPPDNFFDEDIGIYVKGPEANWEEESPHLGANFWQDWERPVHVEFFEEDGSQAFEVDAGIKIFGNYSRANPKKSMSLHFRGEYGTPLLEYPLYPDYPGLNSFDELILRGSGGDESYLHFRDGFHSVLAKDLEFEKQKFRPSVLFINGEYWGLHNIREKSNEDYFKENNNIEKDDIDMIVGWFVKQEGSTADQFVDFHTQLKNDELTYEQILEVIDVNSFIDYYAYEIYIANYDWAGNNCKYWRQSSTNGKWRWFMYDTDFSTGIYDHPGTQVDYSSFSKAMHWEDFIDLGWPSSKNSTLLFSKLLEIPAFKHAFVNRYSDLMNTLFLPQDVFDLMQTEVLDKIQEEVPVNRKRWALGQDEWFEYLTQYKEFWNTRAPYARANMSTEINLDQEVDVTINIVPEGAGYVKLNSIDIEDASWTGIYFKGIPVTLKAVPNAGYSFSGWESTVLILDNVDSVRIDSIDVTVDNTFTANFVGEAVEEFITISEINYHSSIGLDTKDWIEIHNYGTDVLDISGWVLKDDKLYNQYEFPQGTILAADEYILVAEDLDAFKLIYNDLSPIGPLGFGLSNSGETIYLYNNRGELFQEVTYDDKMPWDTYADGLGGALQLLVSGTAVSDALNWVTLCPGGTPLSPHRELCPLGLNDPEEVNNYTLSPNPASQYIEIDEALEIVTLEIYNLKGEKIKVENNENKIDVSVLVSGIYFVSVVTLSDQKVSFKFVKE